MTCITLLSTVWLMAGCGTVEIADGTGGLCEPRCVGANQPVICVNGEEQVLDPCPQDQTCIDGDCQLSTTDTSSGGVDATGSTPDTTTTGPDDIATPEPDIATPEPDITLPEPDTPVEEVSQCTPTCDEKTCGDDGCEGSCGECSGVATCSVDGLCECAPEVGLICNDDGTAVVSAEGCPGAGEVQTACDHGCTEGVCNVCAADCGDKTCGDDGCGGSCGECTGVATCSDEGQCACTPEDELTCSEDGATVIVAEGCPATGSEPLACEHGCVDGACCEPDCGDKDCGEENNGCGGSCGTCTGVATCSIPGYCVCAAEVASVCNTDGTAVIGAEGCSQEGETLAPCDFGCSAGACLGCTDTCGDDKNCGNDACGVSCGTCTGVATCSDEDQCECAEEDVLVCNDDGTAVIIAAGCPDDGTEQEACDYGCTDGACDACVGDCTGKTCGDDGCGVSCGTCTGVAECSEAGQCECAVEVASVCNGDGTAVIGAAGCPDDGTEQEACAYGCTDGACDACVGNCTGKTCGDDGCGVSCGTCTGAATCTEEGLCGCGAEVLPVCNSGGTAVVWPEGCPEAGETVVACEFGCTDGACDGCTADCTGLECGGDGCGGTCGTCVFAATCVDGLCDCGDYTLQMCVEDDVYTMNVCGETGELVTECSFGCSAGQCTLCFPLCGEAECGPDGCGGDCGICEEGATCEDGDCYCEPNVSTTCVEVAGLALGVAEVDSCGNIGSNFISCVFGCEEGACLPCTPLCEPFSCGGDGCGGTCSCSANMICNQALEQCGMCWQDEDCGENLVCAMSDPPFCAQCAQDSDCKGFNKACVNYSCMSLETPTLVINEIDYEQQDADFSEFVELYNAGNTAISTLQMTNVYLYFINKTFLGNVVIESSISLADLLDDPLEPGQYAVVANASAVQEDVAQAH